MCVGVCVCVCVWVGVCGCVYMYVCVLNTHACDERCAFGHSAGCGQVL